MLFFNRDVCDFYEDIPYAHFLLMYLNDRQNMFSNELNLDKSDQFILN